MKSQGEPPGFFIVNYQKILDIYCYISIMINVLTNGTQSGIAHNRYFEVDRAVLAFIRLQFDKEQYCI